MFNKGLIKKLAAVVMSAVTLFSVSGLSSAYVSAADTNHFKFADIDLFQKNLYVLQEQQLTIIHTSKSLGLMRLLY